jgi:hypothetical protein
MEYNDFMPPHFHTKCATIEAIILKCTSQIWSGRNRPVLLSVAKHLTRWTRCFAALSRTSGDVAPQVQAGAKARPLAALRVTTGAAMRRTLEETNVVT